jgi:hypothetical protein
VSYICVLSDSLSISLSLSLLFRYMKYLYPYECEKLQLSSPGELQAAIGKRERAETKVREQGWCVLEGNRREGRRPSYAFEYSSPPQTMPPPPPPPPPAASSTSAFLASPLAHRSCKRHLFSRMERRKEFVVSSGS